jgi:hypothetical protein
VHHVLDVDVGGAQARALDVRGAALHAVCERAHRAREGGGHQMRAVLGRNQRQDRIEVLAETHVEQAVGLVEHDRRERSRIDRAAAQVIEQPAGRADDHARSARELAALVAVARPAGDGDDVRLQIGVQPLQLGLRLTRELAGRRDHQRARRRHTVCRRRRGLGRRGDVGAKREADRQRLAGTGL